MHSETAPGATPASPLLAAMRPRQWVKNLLVLAAPAAAGVLLQATVLVEVAVAFVVMSAASSATYLLNDVRDREADARHPAKRLRPVAAGTLSPTTAVVVAGVLWVGAVLGPLVVGRPLLTVVVVLYGTATTLYSLGLKDVRLLELFVVAAGFVLRAVAGAVAVDVPVSGWFLIVVSAGALHLVATKRHAEQRDQVLADQRPVLRRYPATLLSEVRHSTAAVCLLGYLLWAFEIHDGGVAWYPLSAVPFALALFEYAAAAHDGAGEAPEEVLLTSRPIALYGVAWAVLFALGTYGPTA